MTSDSYHQQEEEPEEPSDYKDVQQPNCLSPGKQPNTEGKHINHGSHLPTCNSIPLIS